MNLNTWEATVGGARVRVTVAEDVSGRPISVDFATPDAPLGARYPTMLQAIGRAVNLTLARGANLREFTHTFKGRAFQPGGDVTGDPTVLMTVSVIDYVAKSIEARYELPPLDPGLRAPEYLVKELA